MHISVELLCLGGDALLVGAGVGLGVHSLLEVGLGVPYHLSEELCELSCVVGLLVGDAAVSLGDLGISLPVGLTAHRDVHTYFRAFACEVCLQAFPYFLVAALATPRV